MCIIIVGFILLLTINTFLYFWGHDRIADIIRLENAYLLVLIITTFGGLSILTSAASFTSMIVFVGAGANPILIALAGATGIFVSDTLYFFLAFFGKKSVPIKWESKLLVLENWMQQRPGWLVLLASYVYLGFTPLPNDFLMFGLALSGYSYKRILAPLVMGNITVAFLITFLGSLAF